MAERFNQLKVMPMDGFTVTKAADSPTGRPRLKIEGFVSRPVPDFDGEIVEVGFFDRFMPEFLANPQMYWCHDGDGQGLWKTMEARPGEGYYGVGEIIHLGGEDDDRRFAQVEEGIVRSLSVGFWGYHTPEYGYCDEDNVWHWTQNGRLMEVSPCTIGACPGAGFTLAKSLGAQLEEFDREGLRMTQEEREEARALKDMTRLADAQESLGNIVAHWAKDGGGPSAEVLSHAVRSITTGARVAKAGRVLSAENRQAIESAISALQDVCARDDEKGCGPKPEDEKSARWVDIVVPARTLTVEVE